MTEDPMRLLDHLQNSHPNGPDQELEVEGWREDPRWEWLTKFHRCLHEEEVHAFHLERTAT